MIRTIVHPPILLKNSTVEVVGELSKTTKVRTAQVQTASEIDRRPIKLTFTTGTGDESFRSASVRPCVTVA